jgi:hypothetical protein
MGFRGEINQELAYALSWLSFKLGFLEKLTIVLVMSAIALHISER